MVSIIVPVYGVEKYLEDCVHSLLVQSYTDLEIILIDDGGKDACPAICDKLAAQDARIRVIHKPNGGAASARNAGLDAAKGEYICFVDGDDWVHPDYVNHLLSNLQDADIGICGFFHSTKSKNEPQTPGQTGVFTNEEYLLQFLTDWSCSLLWNKIFRREIIGDIRMAEGHKIDDEFFTYLVVMNSKSVVITDTPLYYYRIRGSSVMQTMGPHLERIMLDRVEYIITRYRDISERMPQLAEAFFQDTLDTVTRYWYHSKDMPKAQKQIRSWAKLHLGSILKLKRPLKTRLIYLYQLFVQKPAVMSEPNPIQIDPEEYFD